MKNALIFPLRDLPEGLYRLLKEKAKRDRRSLAQEATIALARGLQRDESPCERRRSLLREIEQNPIDKEISDRFDPVSLIREDRER